MIPRYSPTYSYQDLYRSIQKKGTASDNLCDRLAEQYKVKHVFLTRTARVALYLILKAYNRPGGVLLPAYNCIVVPEAVSFAGYSPVFVDIDYCSLNVSAERIEKALTPDVTVVLATHLFGVPCDLDGIGRILRKKDVLFIEDAAPALGAKYCGKLVGSFGDAAIISFQATKVISAETGGALLTNDDQLAEKISRIMNEAAVPGRDFSELVMAVGRRTATIPLLYGVAQFAYRHLRNEQMYEIVEPEREIPAHFLAHCSRFNAALTLTQLERLDWNVCRRKEIARIYQETLANHQKLMIPVIPAGSEPAWIQFQLIADDKWAFYKHMQRRGIDIAWTYRYSCADSYHEIGFDNAQLAAKTVVGLPIYPSLSDQDAHRIAKVAKMYL